MYLAENIRFLREQAGMTQAEFAEKLGGVSQSAVGNWETGKREPNISTVIRIADIFRVILDDLILQQLRPPKPFYASNLTYLREKNDMSLEDVAKLLGYKNQRGVSLVESGEEALWSEDIEKLADYFGITMEQFLMQDLSKGVEQDENDSQGVGQA